MLFFKLFSKLPFWLLFALSDVLAWLLYAVVRYRRKVIYDNLRHSFPEKPASWHKATMRAFYRSFTDTWLEAMKTLDLSAEELAERVHVANPEILRPYEEQEKSLFFLTGHNSNWEWLFLRGSISVKNVMGVYLKVDNPFFDKLMYRIRNRFGVRLLEKADLLREVVRSRGQYRNIAMVADQAPRKGTNRFWHSFMNRPAAFFNSAEKLVTKEGVAVFYVGIKRRKRGHYTIWYEELGQPPYEQLPEGELTSRYIKTLEKNIRLQPEIYLWSHKRWKHKAPADFTVNEG